MKIFKYLFIVLIIPVKLFAQDPNVVKQQANVMATATIKGDYPTLIAHTYPKLVNMMGGKEKAITLVSQAMAQMKSQGITVEKAVVGAPAKFYKAGSEIHCLVPENVTMAMPKGHASGSSNMLGISADGGKTWSFVDLNKATIDKIPQLFPNFNKDLKIPEPTFTMSK